MRRRRGRATLVAGPAARCAGCGSVVRRAAGPAGRACRRRRRFPAAGPRRAGWRSAAARPSGTEPAPGLPSHSARGWRRGRVAPRTGPAHPHRAGAPRPTGPGHRAARGGDAGGSAAQSLQPGGARRLLHAQQPIQVVALLSSGRAASSVCSCCVACSRTVVMSRSQAGSG